MQAVERIDVIPARLLAAVRQTGSIRAACKALKYDPSNGSRVLREMCGVRLAAPHLHGNRRELFARGFAQAFDVEICPDGEFIADNAFPLGAL